jgi:hypothetical protein
MIVKSSTYIPTSITITFETESEYKMFCRVMSRDLTIPNLVCKNNPVDKELLTTMMNIIHLEMTNK